MRIDTLRIRSIFGRPSCRACTYLKCEWMCSHRVRTRTRTHRRRCDWVRWAVTSCNAHQLNRAMGTFVGGNLPGC